MIKILIAEDHADNREMLTRRLTRRGFAVVEAEDGVQAVRQALCERPDLILMDISMPNMSGLEAARAIRATMAGARIPIIALTAHAMESARVDAEGAGCDAFATKPVDFPGLIALIESLVAKRAAGVGG